MPDSDPTDAADRSDLAARWRSEWLALGAWRHAAALALLSLVALALYRAPLLDPATHGDEVLYAAAGARVADGESPFAVPGYYYPAAFARAWAASAKLSAPIPAWIPWRVANLAAAVALVWLAACHLPVGRRRWWIAPLLCSPLLAAPGFQLALRDGNLSVLTGMMIAAGVLLSGRRWIVAGLLLGLSVAIKPLALPALMALAVPWRPPGSTRERWSGSEQRTAALGIALAAVLLLAVPGWRDLLAQPVQALTAIRTVSLARLLDLLGLPLPRAAVLALAYGVIALAAWRFTSTRTERVVAALAGAMVAAPLVWSHTLLLGLPMLTLAASLYWPLLAPRERETPMTTGRAAGPGRLVAFAALAAVALQLFVQPGGFDHHGRLVQLALALPMLAAPPLTAVLVGARLRRDRAGPVRAVSAASGGIAQRP